MSTIHLEKIFEPKSIAVIGASEREGSVGYIIFQNLRSSGYSGKVYPINAKRGEVRGVKAYPSVLNLPEKVDLAVICTPASTVPELVEECGQAGIKGIIIISAGFAEMGEEGRKLMKIIDDIRKKYDQRIIGPNCLGVIRPKTKMNASFGEEIPNHGKLAFISQSGALGTAVLDWAISNNVGFSHFVSLGSTLDVSFGDLIDYFGADNETQSIILYMESISDAQKFMSATRGFAMNKPIIVVKAGRAAEGAKAAASHTGALAGEDDIYDAAFRRAGIVRVDEVEDLFDCAESLVMQPTPKGNNLVIITNAGGPGVMATDSLIKCNGKLAPLSAETIKKLNEVLPPFWSRSNPVDVLGDADAERYSKALDICLRDKNIDCALVILTPQAMTKPDEIAKILVEKAKEQSKPILSSWMGAKLVEEGRRVLREGSIPSYETPEQAVKAFMYMYQYNKNIGLLYKTPENVKFAHPPIQNIKENIRKVYASGRLILSELESKEILDFYGIPATIPKLAKTPNDAKKIANSIGFPVAMKIQSQDISHKSDANCVMLNIKSEQEAMQKFEEIIKNAKNYNKKAKLDGVTVQKMVSAKGHEVILGSKKDSFFGSVILFGMGGIAVEAIKDRNIGFPPLNQSLAKLLIEGTKVSKLLKEGYRAIPPGNMNLLQAILVRFSQLLVDLPEIREIDINPLIVNDRECLALDARILLDENYFKTNPKPYDHLVISPYPRQYIKRINFKGTDILLRPIRPEDGPMWLEMFDSLSEETTKQRFFHIIKEMSKEKLLRYTYNDYSREIAIIAEVKDGEKKKMVGVVRMVGDANYEKAEFSIIISDKWQGIGLGSYMSDYIISIAKEKGLKQIFASVFTDNMRMIRLCRKRGFKAMPGADANIYNMVYDII